MLTHSCITVYVHMRSAWAALPHVMQHATGLHDLPLPHTKPIAQPSGVGLAQFGVMQRKMRHMCAHTHIGRAETAPSIGDSTCHSECALRDLWHPRRIQGVCARAYMCLCMCDDVQHGGAVRGWSSITGSNITANKAGQVSARDECVCFLHA